MSVTSTVNVKIRRLSEDAVIPTYATELAAGFDLVAVEDVIIAPGETKLVPLGFALELPAGTEMQIRPRSGVTLKTKLRVANSPATIDADFRGEVAVIIDNIAAFVRGSIAYETLSNDAVETETTHHYDSRWGEYTEQKKVPYNTYLIHKGDRIAQGIIAPIYRAQFTEVAELCETERGSGGFGSTGVNGTEVKA